MLYEISFPGLGIGPFTFDGIAFSVGSIEVRWYGVIICIGMILAYTYSWTRAKHEGIKTDDLIDLALVLLISGIAGARLYYVIFELDQYLVKGSNVLDSIWQSFVAMISIQNGGLAIYGGIIGGAIGAYVFSRYKKIRFPVLCDTVAPGLLIGQIIGRFGNFVNAEAHGGVTDLPWRMKILKMYPNSDGSNVFRDEMNALSYHPTFLYESLWNLVGFAVIAVFYKKKKFNGQWILFYFAWYGLGRFMIESLRTDSLMLGPIRVSQALSAVLFLGAVTLLTLGFVRSKRDATAAEACQDSQIEGE